MIINHISYKKKQRVNLKNVVKIESRGKKAKKFPYHYDNNDNKYNSSNSSYSEDE